MCSILDSKWYPIESNSCYSYMCMYDVFKLRFLAYRNSAGCVYLRFETVEGAMGAQRAMHMRWFACRSISALYMVMSCCLYFLCSTSCIHSEFKRIFLFCSNPMCMKPSLMLELEEVLTCRITEKKLFWRVLLDMLKLEDKQSSSVLFPPFPWVSR